MRYAFTVGTLGLAACGGAGAPQLVTPQTVTPPVAQRLPAGPLGKEIRGIYVSDSKNGDIAIFNAKSYKQISTITQGISGPDGEWIDRKGNFYVANVGATDIAEYGPGQSTPKFTYSAGIVNTFREVVDKNGNVYGVDGNLGHLPSFINMYPQGVNKVTRQYKIEGDVSDLTFDAAGNMYVDVDNQGSPPSGFLLEFPKGKTKAKYLGVQTGWAYSMVMDPQRNLVVGDLNAGAIDIIPPPYTKIGSQIRGFAEPYSLAFNAGATKLYVVDLSANSIQPVVDVLQYPSGKMITQLGTGNGLGFPYGVAADPEFQYY